MNFRTILSKEEIERSDKQIDYQSKITLIGSCFVENIGEKLSYYKFDTLINPYGILFNPISIERFLSDIESNKTYTEADLIYNQGIWHSLHHHSKFSNPNKSFVLQNINNAILEAKKEIEKASHIIITYGTAWIYYHKVLHEYVANCHKIPQNEFDKHLLSLSELLDSMNKSLVYLKRLNSNAKIIFTLSPVRHIRDGMISSSRSKAHLLTAIHELIDNNSFYYFPSYEILMDDLREYRFYKSDMIHPNDVALTYIWELFKNTWINERSYTVMHLVDNVQRAMQHKVFNPDTASHQKFVEDVQKKKDILLKTHNISFD